MRNSLQELPIEATPPIPKLGIDRMYEYLAQRGITSLEEIDKLGIRILHTMQIGKFNDDRGAIVIPHHDVSGNELDWWSARLVDLAPPETKGFRALVPTKRAKMYCPPGEPPLPYFAPIIDWTNIGRGAVIYIHESAIKAINGAKLGTYSVGLNGVWGWCSKKHDIALLPMLRDLPWRAKELTCVVVFDSNAESNDDVALAIRRFAERMRAIVGVTVRHMLLPKPPAELGKEDWGFDDYVHHYGPQQATAWLDSWQETSVEVEISELEAMKLELNNEVCIVRSLKKVVDRGTGAVMGRTDFCDINYADRVAWVEEGERVRQVNVPRMWLQWERRRVVNDMDYMPGVGEIHEGRLNTWRGMGLEPAAGDVGRWLQILEHNVPDAGLRKWIIQWMAYPLQHLGAKLATYLHLYGPPGTGKQAILAPLMRIYGRNAVTVGRDNMASDFNSVYAHKQFINLDELHGGATESGVKINNKIKMLVTGERIIVNRKGEPEYEITNCVQLVTTSNYVDSLKLDDDDRRACVIRFGERGCQLSGEFWQAYFPWVDGGGAAAVYDHLLNVDLAGFDPKGWAPMTEDKKAVTAAARGAMDAFVADLIEDADSVLMPLLAGARVVTVDQLVLSYLADDPMGRPTPGVKNALAQKLANAGLKKTALRHDGKVLKVWELDSGGRSLDDLRKEISRFRGKI